jgi:hypothetical protein
MYDHRATFSWIYAEPCALGQLARNYVPNICENRSAFGDKVPHMYIIFR